MLFILVNIINITLATVVKQLFLWWGMIIMLFWTDFEDLSLKNCELWITHIFLNYSCIIIFLTIILQ